MPDGRIKARPVEGVGGFGIIDVADLDEALALARSRPVGGYVEIRPLVSPSGWTEAGGYPQQITQRGRGQAVEIASSWPNKVGIRIELRPVVES